jgi:hypothetical protein
MSSSVSAAPASRPATSEVEAAVRDFVQRNSSNVTIGTVKGIKLAQDEDGTWWASASAVPSSPSGLEAVMVFIHKENGDWALFDLGTGIDTDKLPPGVRDEL